MGFEVGRWNREESSIDLQASFLVIAHQYDPGYSADGYSDFARYGICSEPVVGRVCRVRIANQAISRE